MDYTGEINGKEHDRWESILVPVWQMMINGKKVRSVVVPYEPPAEQTEIEETDATYDMKRVEQLNAFVITLGELLGEEFKPVR